MRVMEKSQVLKKLAEIIEELEQLINEADGSEGVSDKLIESMDTGLGELKYIYKQENT